MTAALILATVGLKYRFSYVGGGSRNKNGVGIVIDGHEKMFEEMSPWSIFAEEERRQVVTLFNSRRFSAVNEIINIAYKHDLPIQIRDYFRFVQPIAEGLLKWDQFEHKVALPLLGDGISLLEDYIHLIPIKLLKLFVAELKTVKSISKRLFL